MLLLYSNYLQCTIIIVTRQYVPGLFWFHYLSFHKWYCFIAHCGNAQMIINVYPCNLCDVNVKSCPQCIHIFLNMQLDFSVFKNFPIHILSDSLQINNFPL